MGAELQQVDLYPRPWPPLQVVYREYLPVVLGSAALDSLSSTSTTYDPSIDPSILNEFATVAYR